MSPYLNPNSLPCVNAEAALEQQKTDEHLHPSQWPWKLALGATAGVIAAPYLSSLVGAPSTTTTQILSLCQASSPSGTGLASFLNEGFASIPVVGNTLAAGGWGNAAASGLLGIGGVLLGNYISKHYDRHGHLPWGKIIKYAALATSLLIALPSLLSGISMGLTFLAYGIGGAALASSVIGAASSTLGLMGSINIMTAGAGLAGLASHFVTCGAALLPVGSAIFGSQHQHGNPSTFSIKPLPHAPVSKGQPCELAFQLIDDATGRALGDDELATVHTKKIHTMIVDASLSDYHHVHPTYDSARKLFTCQFTPTRQANYAMWNDFKVLGEQPTQVKSELCATRAFSIPARIDSAREVVADGLRIRITPDTPLRAGQNTMLRIDVCDASTGKPVDNLEPIMGAFAHLAGFSADGNHFTHIHPLGDEPQSDTARGTGHLNFHITPDIAGGTKFFLQIQRAGQIITVPFGAMVAPALGFTQKLAAPAASHSHHAMA